MSIEYILETQNTLVNYNTFVSVIAYIDRYIDI